MGGSAQWWCAHFVGAYVCVWVCGCVCVDWWGGEQVTWSRIFQVSDVQAFEIKPSNTSKVGKYFFLCFWAVLSGAHSL